MHKIGERRIYSPSDLTEFMESRYASWMSRLALEHPDRAPIPEESRAPGFKSAEQIIREHGEPLLPHLRRGRGLV